MQGHTTMLTALQLLRNSPILASSDDSGTIRLWDIRTFACIQKVNYGKRTQILQLIDLSEQGKMCFLGSRLNMIYFNATPKKQQDNYPVRLEFMKNHLIVGTRCDIQYLDIFTGQVEKILVIQDVSQVRFLRQRFLIADQKGSIKEHHAFTGEVLKKLKGHQGEVSFLKLDNVNQLIVSASRDQLLIQKQ